MARKHDDTPDSSRTDTESAATIYDTVINFIENGEFPRLRLTIDGGTRVEVAVMDMDYRHRDDPNRGYVMLSVEQVGDARPVMAITLDDYDTDEVLAVSETGKVYAEQHGRNDYQVEFCLTNAAHTVQTPKVGDVVGIERVD
jgi:hypothetical protein